jgi:RND family efflux transporter MFP subunit
MNTHIAVVAVPLFLRETIAVIIPALRALVDRAIAIVVFSVTALFCARVDPGVRVIAVSRTLAKAIPIIIVWIVCPDWSSTGNEQQEYEAGKAFHCRESTLPQATRVSLESEVEMRAAWIGLLLLTLLAPGCEAGMGGPGEEEEDWKPVDRRLLVEVSAVDRGDVSDHLETTGILESLSQAEIIPETTGRVQEISAEEGAWVEAGQTLALIGNPSLEASLNRARIERDSAKRAAAKAQDLFDRGAISQQELDSALDSYQTAKASWSEATATQGFTVVRAPISGEVVSVDIRVGEQAGTSRAFHLVDTRSMRVVTELPEMDLVRLKKDQAVELSSAYETRDLETGAATPPVTVVGLVQHVGRVIDPTKGTARVIISVEDEEGALRPGQFLRVRVEVDQHTDVLRVPRMAVIWDGFEAITWRMVEAPEKVIADTMRKAPGHQEPGKRGEEDEEDEPDLSPWEDVPRRMAQKARVDLGYQDDLWVEILSGLNEGDEVILEGNTNLREKSLLRLPDDPDLKGLDEDEDDE